jgi:hypothetical protein
MIKHFAGKVDGVKFNESELRADFLNNSRITLYGADNPDSLRGIGLDGVVFDEYSQQPSNIFTEIIRPALADRKGYAIWIGTPKGKNDFYRLYQTAKKDDDWLGILLTVDDTGLISPEELADSRKVMTDDEYRQEWYCSFEAAIKGAYYADEIANARKEGRITTLSYEREIPVYTYWDLGVSDSTAIGFFQKVNQEVRMIDYLEASDKGLDWYAKELKNRGYLYAKHIAPHDITVRELTTGKSRLEIAQTLGINFDVLPKLAFIDGINAGRLMFSRLWVDETKCARWLDYIAQYCREWDDNRGMFKDAPLHDFTSHAADMYRYCAIGEGLMSNERGAILTKDYTSNNPKAPFVKDGFMTEVYEEPPKDWRYL